MNSFEDKSGLNFAIGIGMALRKRGQAPIFNLLAQGTLDCHIRQLFSILYFTLASSWLIFWATGLAPRS